MTDFFPFLIAALIILVTFITAMKQGVVKLLASGLAAAVLLIVLAVSLHWIPELAVRLLDVDLSFKVTLGASSLLAILSYAAARICFGWIVRKAVGPDSWFHWMVDGVPGGILSLIPSLIIVFF
ncbi:MAG: hypothetical protein AAF357_11690, partial [Verrucomicrobiota bacterium]